MLVGTATGCFWRRYPYLLETHVQLLSDMAEKGRDLVVGGRFTAETLAELLYPYERATAYERDARQRSGDAVPASLDAFRALLATYRELVTTLDDSRRRGRDDAASVQPVVDAVLGRVQQDAQRVRAALADEAREDTAVHGP